MTQAGIELEERGRSRVLVLKFYKAKCAIKLNPDEWSMLIQYTYAADREREKNCKKKVRK